MIAAVFSALTHSRGPEAGGILEALAAALNTIDTDTAGNLAEFVSIGLGTTASQHIWKVLMATVSYPYASPLRAHFVAQGEAKAVLRILSRRGITVDDASRERIESCTDIEILESWLDRSLTAERATDLFD